MTVCAIHQPNFFPWLGYFDKIERADVFVVMDGIAAPKGATWINRVAIEIQGNRHFVTCPVRRWHGQKPVWEMVINDTVPWRRKLVRSLEVHYGTARNYHVAMPVMRRLLAFEDPRLTEFNLNAIATIGRLLGIEATMVRQSQLPPSSAKGTELLIELTKAVGCDTYLCGGGASGYQEDDLFPASGLTLRYQRYSPSVYGDPEAFLPGLSVIDFLMKTTDPLDWGAA